MTMAFGQTTQARGPSPCPDCPACRQGLLSGLVRGGDPACAFRCASLETRSPIPRRWFEEHAVGFVRRGVLVRQRADAQGRVTAFDAAGPGCLFPLQTPEAMNSGSIPCGYAATDVLVCLCPRDDLSVAVSTDTPVAQDIIELQQAALERVVRITDARGRPGITARVSALLAALSDTLSPPRQRDLLPSGLQLRDLGALLGIRHETVCRALRTLTDRGIVERTPDGLRIVDREALDAF